MLPLPCTVDDVDQIVLLRALRAAGLVQATIPQQLRVNGRPFQPAATVQLVTRQGWNALIAAHAEKEPQRRATLERREPTAKGSERRIAP